MRHRVFSLVVNIRIGDKQTACLFAICLSPIALNVKPFQAYLPISSSCFKNLGVNPTLLLATSSGVPAERRRPPLRPPSGPMSMIWSASLITSRLCSMISTVLPRSTSFCNTSIRMRISSKCSPVVGSSRMYMVFPVSRLLSSVANFTR